MMNPLYFQTCNKVFHRCIVVPAPYTVHAGFFNVLGFQDRGAIIFRATYLVWVTSPFILRDSVRYGGEISLRD